MLTNSAPIFGQSVYSFEVASGSSFIGTVSASDPDADEVSLSSDSGDFYVDSYSGAIYFYGLSVAGGTHSFNITATDGLDTTSVPVTVTFTGSPGYDETQQLADTLIDDDYYTPEQNYYDTVNNYTYDTDSYYTDPNYQSAWENSPVGDMTGTFGDTGYYDYYDTMAQQAQQNAAEEQASANDTSTTTPPTGPGTGTPDTAESEIDPRLRWTPFSFTDDFDFPEESLPAQGFLDDLFSLTPTGTESFSTTTLLAAAPIVQNLTVDGTVTGKQSSTNTLVTLSQEWLGPDEWTVTQSITRFFESDETGDYGEGRTDAIRRTGSATLTISVINGTRSIVTYSISDSFGYSHRLEWDAFPEANDPDGIPIHGDSNSGDPDDEAPIDRGLFLAGFQATASMTVSLETALITLPDGRSARQYSLGFATGSTFSSTLDASTQFRQKEGTLKRFQPNEPNAGSTGDPQDPDDNSEGNGNDSPTDDDETFLTAEHGGNGSAVDFAGTFRFNESFSKNFGLNLSAIVPEGESLDDAEVTGSGTFDVAVGTSQGGTSTLNIQLQASTGNPATGSGGHEYISFVSTLAPESGADFTFDINFDIAPPAPPSDDPEPPPPDTTTGDSDDDSTPPPPPNFSFTYNTRNAEGGSSILLYEKEEVFGDPSGNVTITETLTASGTLTASATFGFSLDGISLTVSSSGNGETEYKSAIVNRAAPPDLSTPTEWTGAWHYPEMRTEVTVTTTGSFAADVTLGFSLTAGLTLDAHFSADFEIVSSELTRTDWIYWETETDGTNTYREQGYAAVVDTTTYTFAGNLDDGFNADLVQDWRFHGDVSSEGIRHVGPPPTPPEEQHWLNPETILDGVQLGLDVAGLIPGLGEPLDAINAGINLARGNYADAALSLAAMYPFGGQAATATKLGRKAGAAVLRNLDKADDAVVGISKMGDELSHMILNQPCFPAGTPILTPLGSIPIEHLKPGDVVLSRPENDVYAPVELCEVEQVYARESEVYELTVGGRTIQTTGEHPFWVKGHGWVAAVELEEGDEFSTHTGGMDSARRDPVYWPVDRRLQLPGCRHPHLLRRRSHLAVLRLGA